MSNQQAIASLRTLCHNCELFPKCVHEKPECFQAIEMAISALQAQEAKTQLSAEGTTSDLISRQDAIDRINKQREHLQPDIYPQDKIGDAAYRICAEFIERLPSAHPEIEERKEESAQNVPKEDLISRKEAIDAECEVCQIAPKKERGHNCIYYVHGCKEIECLRVLPSAQPDVLACGEGVLNAQPEIIRCKDCRYCDIGIDEDGNPFLKCLGWVYGGTQEEDFCSHAERRTE